MSETAKHRWTRHHILLHWAAALLIVMQFASGQFMPAQFAARLADSDSTGGITIVSSALHVAIGLLIFLAIVARLLDRAIHGRPPRAAGEPVWARALAAATQYALYALVFAMPIAGAIAWFGEYETLGTLHALAAKLLLALLVLHVAGALAEHYWFKTDTLSRMMPGQGRKTAISRQPRAEASRQ